MRKLSEGAESIIYNTRFLGLGSVIKRRVKKHYRINEIDDTIRSRRTKNEAKIMCAVSSLSIRSPKVLLVGKYDITMSKIIGVNLNTYNLLDAATAKKLVGVFSTLGKYAALLHNSNVVHGDYTPANIMINKGNVFLIDFGLSEFNSSIEEKAIDLLLMKRSIKKESFRMLIKSYTKKCKNSIKIIKKLEEIEKRGRYNTRTLIAGQDDET